MINFVLVTNDLYAVHNGIVLVLGSNKGVYIKDWNRDYVKTIEGIDTHVVKLERKYFKPYTFKNDFVGFETCKDYTFDELKEIAAIQTSYVRQHHGSYVLDKNRMIRIC